MQRKVFHHVCIIASKVDVGQFADHRGARASRTFVCHVQATAQTGA